METNQTILPPITSINTPTPTSKVQQPTPLSSPNGVLRLHHLHHHPRHHHHHNGVVVTYKECLKNHAATMGGHAVDGCGEFIPSPKISPSDPTLLTCDACGCHRNFHRREQEEPPFPPPPNTTPLLEFQPHHRHHPLPPPPLPNTISHTTPPSSPSPPPISASYYHPSAPSHMLLSLSHTTNTPNSPSLSNPNARKRFRTKFTQTQKDKMVEFAEKIEWRIQKRDEEIINGFCDNIAIEKGVLKVWMHNNKGTLGKKYQNLNDTGGNGVGSGGAPVMAEEPSAGSQNHLHELQQLRRDFDNNGGGHVVATSTINNGSGSSS